MRIAWVLFIPEFSVQMSPSARPSSPDFQDQSFSMAALTFPSQLGGA